MIDQLHFNGLLVLILVGLLAWIAVPQVSVQLVQGRVRRIWSEGRRAFEAGNYNEAAELFVAALADMEAAEADVGHAYGWAASCCQLAGRYAEAIDYYRREAALYPDADAPKQALAYLLASVPDDSLRDGPAAKQLARSLQASTDGEDWPRMTTLAAALAECGEFEEACELYAAAMQCMPRADREQRLDTLEKLRQGQPLRCSPEMDQARMIEKQVAAD
jgi:tetratricopeptide (TPR) repeat protein